MTYKPKHMKKSAEDLVDWVEVTALISDAAWGRYFYPVPGWGKLDMPTCEKIAKAVRDYLADKDS